MSDRRGWGHHPPMPETDLLARAESLWMADPVVAYLAIAVAGAQTGGAVAEIDGKQVLLPDWGDDAWRWYGETLLSLADAARTSSGSDAASEARFSAAVEEIRDALTDSQTAPESVTGVVAIAVWAVRLFRAAGPILVRLGRASKPVIAAGWARVRAAFGKAPLSITAATIAAASPEAAEKIIRATVELAKQLFGHAATAVVRGVAGGLGPLGLIALGVGAYFLFLRR